MEYDDRAETLTVDGVVRTLEPIPRRLLHRLLLGGGEAVAKEALIAAGWRSTRALTDASFYNAMRRLRATLGEAARDLIVLEQGRGWRIALPITAVLSPSPARPTLTLQIDDPVPGLASWHLMALLGSEERRDVWRAQHCDTGENRVFKFAEDVERRQRLMREIAASRRLREAAPEQEGFVAVLDAAMEAHPARLEMEDGGLDLIRWVADSGGLSAIPQQRRLAVIIQAAELIGVAHGVGVLHGNLTPRSILVQNWGGDIRVRIVGFEAERDPWRLCHPGAAPELHGEAACTTASDIYSLGILLHQLMVGDMQCRLTAGWELEIDDPLLSADIAEAAHGDPARRLPSATLLADRLRALDDRRAAAVREAAAAREAAAQMEAARESIHTASLARRTQLAALVLLVLLMVAVGFAISARRAQRIAAAERSRATQTAAVLQNTVSGLIDLITNHLSDRAGVTLAMRNAMLAETEQVLAEMTRLAPKATTQQLAARALTAFSDIYRHEGDAGRAAQAAQDAIDLQRSLLRAQPNDDILRLAMAESLQRLGDALMDDRQLRAALTAYQAALTRLQDLSKRHGDDEASSRRVVEADYKVGRAFDEQQKPEASLAIYQQAVASAEQHLASQPANPDWLEVLSNGRINICDALEELGRVQEALAACVAGRDAKQRLYDQDPADTRRHRNLVVAWEDVGNEQELLGQLKVALASYQRAVALQRPLAAADTANAQWQEGLAVAAADVGDVQVKLGDFVGAIASYRLSVDIANRLLAGAPGSISWQRLAGVDENNLGDYLFRSGDAGDALPHLQRAAMLMQALLRQRPDDAALTQSLNEVVAMEQRVWRTEIPGGAEPKR